MEIIFPEENNSPWTRKNVMLGQEWVLETVTGGIPDRPENHKVMLLQRRQKAAVSRYYRWNSVSSILDVVASLEGQADDANWWWLDRLVSVQCVITSPYTHYHPSCWPQYGHQFAQRRHSNTAITTHRTPVFLDTETQKPPLEVAPTTSATWSFTWLLLSYS